jgi:anti-sigma regulatory factor (Ser/Thr protein kinase)
VTSPTFSLVLPPAASSPRAARVAVAEELGDRNRLDELLLCVSEVVTNAVLHGRSAARIVVSVDEADVRVEVHDDDPTLPVRRHPATDSPTGRGLLMLDRLTSRWGAEPSGRGKVVWFEFDLGEPA